MSAFRMRVLMKLFILLGLLTSSFAIAAPALSTREVLHSAGLPPHSLSKIDRGEIIAHNIQEVTDKEISMSTAIYLAAPLDKVVNHLKSL